MGLDINKVWNLVYPPSLYCICCGNLIDETRTYNLCDHCITHIKWDTESPREVDGLKMFRCAEYGIYERTLIFSLKYNGKRYIARDLGRMMADRIKLTGMDFDVIVPVPMHGEKEKARGFNQAALMGKYMGKELGTECVAHGLIRGEHTRPMRGLSPTERAENVRGKFKINEKYVKMLQGKRILLIDDFYTTGSTARECAGVLSEAEPQDIVFLAFAAKY